MTWAFLLRDVELVEPADDLDLLPSALVNALNQLTDQRVGMEQVGGQQQLGLIPDALKEKGHCLVQSVALSLEKQPVELFVFAAVELQLHSFLPVEARQIDIGSMLKDLWAGPGPRDDSERGSRGPGNRAVP